MAPRDSVTCMNSTYLTLSGNNIILQHLAIDLDIHVYLLISYIYLVDGMATIHLVIYGCSAMVNSSRLMPLTHQQADTDILQWYISSICLYLGEWIKVRNDSMISMHSISIPMNGVEL